MGLTNADSQLLEKKLNQLIDIMVNQLGLLPRMNKETKQNLVQGLVENLSNDNSLDKINPEALRKNDDDLLKRLATACQLHLLKLDYKFLFKKDENVPEKKLEESFNLLLKMMLKLSPKYQAADQNKQQVMEAKLEEMAKLMAKRSKRENIVDLIAAMTDTLSDQRRTLYGVDRSGEEFRPVLGVQFGNMMALLDMAEEGNSFMAESNKADFGVPDPNGVKLASIINSLDESPSLVDELENAGMLAPEPGEEKTTYKTPTLKPPGIPGS